MFIKTLGTTNRNPEQPLNIDNKTVPIRKNNMYTKDYDMNDLQNAINEPNKDFAKTIMKCFEEEGFLEEEDIKLLLSREKCREQFYSDYAILKKVDINIDLHSQITDRTNRNRYYNDVHQINGEYYVMTSQFYGLGGQLTHKDNRTPLWQWVMSKKSNNGVVKIEATSKEYIENIKMIMSPKVGKSRLRQLSNACSLTTEYSL